MTKMFELAIARQKQANKIVYLIKKYNERISKMSDDEIKRIELLIFSQDYETLEICLRGGKLETKSISELRQIASALRISYYSNLTKAQLIAIIERNK